MNNAWQVEWDEARVQQYIDNQIQESLTLDYKGADALDRRNPKHIEEITKDVSALANSSGGLIIYGVAEFDDDVRRHLPRQIDPIDSTRYTREWLDQIIATIRPKIENLIIHPVPLATATNHTVYVVEVPQSDTAHQARDKRYYKRFNFTSEAMEDYEIRDVMGRSQHPKLHLEFKLSTYQQEDRSPERLWEQGLPTITRYRLEVFAVNTGNVYTQYVNTFIHVDSKLVDGMYQGQRKTLKDGIEYLLFSTDNMHEGLTTYGPFLPHVARHWTFIHLASCFNPTDCGDCDVWWTTHADNAPVNSGISLFKDIGLT